jgi:DNA-binding transcriptional LysR family regulator
MFQVPEFHAERHLAIGALVPILIDDLPPAVPVSLLYSPADNFPRAFACS